MSLECLPPPPVISNSGFTSRCPVISYSCWWMCGSLTPCLHLVLYAKGALPSRQIPSLNSQTPPSYIYSWELSLGSDSHTTIPKPTEGDSENLDSGWPRSGHPHSYHVKMRKEKVGGGNKDNHKSPISIHTTPSTAHLLVFSESAALCHKAKPMTSDGTLMSP